MRKKKNDNLSLNGLSKIAHSFVMFILYPFRKPLIFLPIVLFAYLIPTFIGAKPMEVHTWYWNKLKLLGEEISVQSKDIISMSGINLDALPSSFSDKPIVGGGMKKVVNIPQPEANRRAFEKSKDTNNIIIMKKNIIENDNSLNSSGENGFNNLNAKQDMINAYNAAVNDAKDIVIGDEENYVADSVNNNIANSTNNDVEDYKKDKKTINLNYLAQPEYVSGIPQIINANELVVNDKHLFLYGIYVDPLSSLGIDALVFLESNIANKPIDCTINAYTLQNMPTANCYYKSISINQELVNKGYSKKVMAD